jgi:hypothetical protein
LDSRIREDIVDRGIERGEWEMRNLGKQLGYENSDQEPHVGPVGDHNSGQMAADASEDEGSTRPDINKDDIRDRKVDPEAVRESFKEAELDPIAESEPEEGEKAA